MQNHAPFSSPILQLLGSHSKTYFWFLPAEHAFIFLKLAHLYVILNDRLEVAWKIKSFKDFVKLVLWNVSKLESNTFSMVSFGLYFFYPERSKISFVKSENSFFCKYAYLQNILYFCDKRKTVGEYFMDTIHYYSILKRVESPFSIMDVSDFPHELLSIKTQFNKSPLVYIL